MLDRRVKAAAAYPISWNEVPAYQRIYDDGIKADLDPSTATATIGGFWNPHDDYASAGSS